jgi:hypothetical protein
VRCPVAFRSRAAIEDYPTWQSSVLYRLFIEAICITEFIRLCYRSKKYVAITAAMYFRSFVSLYRTHVLRATYCLARLIDDILDGDCITRVAPRGRIVQLRDEIIAGRFVTRDRLSLLAKYLLPVFALYSKQGEDIRQLFIGLIDRMIADYDRCEKKEVWSTKKLDDHHFVTFQSALDITFAIVGSPIRSADIPELPRAQASLYAVRDLRDDISKGLINIGREFIGDNCVCSTGANLGEWMAHEIKQGAECVNRLSEIYSEMRDPRAKRVVGPLLAGLRGILKTSNQARGIDFCWLHAELSGGRETLPRDWLSGASTVLDH